MTRGQKFLASQSMEEEILTVTQAYADPEVRKAVEEEPFRAGPSTVFQAARLAEDAGFDVDVGVIRFEDEPIVSWAVTVAPKAAKQISALAWIDSYGNLDYTATRSTRPGVGWQLTSWARDSAPWGHADLVALTDAFDTGLRGAGVSLEGLAQVVLADGRVLVREGVEPLAMNPSSRAVRLARRLANP